MRRPPRAVAFVGVGALGMGVQLGTVWGAIAWGEMDVSVATALGVAAAVAHNFVWHWSWTWGDRRGAGSSTAWTFLRFVAANGAVSLAVNVAIVSVLVRVLPIHGVVANMAAIAVCAAGNYWTSDRLVFTAEGDCYH